jgi:probable HAF family extracellular repeat protein
MRIKPTCLRAVMACGFAASAHAAPAYQFTDLGPGMAFAINNLGQVAGTIDIPTPNEEYGSATHAALFSGGTVTDLGTLGGKPSSSSFATSINDAGTVAGWSYIPSTTLDPRGHVYGYTSFVYQNGQMSPITSDNSNKAYGINNQGQTAVTYGDLSVYTDEDSRTAYIHTGGQREQIVSPAGGPIGVSALNNHGQATGDFRTSSSGIASDSPQHAYLYSNGVATDLGTLGGANSVGTDINNHGQVTGSADSDPIHGATHAFLYNQGHMTDLGTLGGASSQGLSLNDRGQVVGYSYVGQSFAPIEAFLYSGGQMISLQKLMAPVVGPDWTLTEATGINERGDITGWGSFNGQLHGFVLTAVPEPEVMALALSGLACVGLRLVPGKRARRGAQARASNANAAA